MNLTPELLWGIGIVILLLALAWGAMQHKRRNRANDPITEEATRELREHPETYDRKREELKKQVKPS